MGESTMRRACVVGLGDILKGDLGAGCAVLEALSLELPEDSVDLFYLGNDSLYVDECVYGTGFSIIIQAIPLGWPKGKVCRWNLDTLRNNLYWLSDHSESTRLLARALARVEFVGGLPAELTILWLGAGSTQGLGLSKEACKAVRSAVEIIKSLLVTRGYLPERIRQLSIIHRLDLFDSHP